MFQRQRTQRAFYFVKPIEKPESCQFAGCEVIASQLKLPHLRAQVGTSIPDMVEDALHITRELVRSGQH